MLGGVEPIRRPPELSPEAKELIIRAESLLASFRREVGLPREPEEADMALLTRIISGNLGIEDLIDEDKAIEDRWGVVAMSQEALSLYNSAQLLVLKAGMMTKGMSAAEAIESMAVAFALIARELVESCTESGAHGETIRILTAHIVNGVELILNFPYEN